MTTDCICSNCFLWHEKKNYCSLDGKFHEGCIKNYMPKTNNEPNIEGEL